MKKILLVLAFCSTCLAGTDVQRPDTDSDLSSPVFCGNGSPNDFEGLGTSNVFPNAYDNDLLTYDSMDLDTAEYGVGTFRHTRVVSGWQTPIYTYSALTLSIRSFCSYNVESGYSLTQCSEGYSTDGGTSWTKIISASKWAGTQTVSLPPSTDLTQLRVYVCVAAQASPSTPPNPPNEGYVNINLADVETQGTY